MHGLCVGDPEARADCQCGELIDRIAAGAPVRELLFVEALGDTRVPFAGYRPDHRAGVELGTIDAHRAAETAADLERRLDDGVAREARRDRFEIGDFAGWAARAIPFLLVRSGGCTRSSIRCGQNGPPACGQRSRRRQSLALWASLPSARRVSILYPLGAGPALFCNHRVDF